MTNKECIYDICWTGKCKNQATENSDFCKDHLGKGCQINVPEREEWGFEKTITSQELLKIIGHNFTGFSRFMSIESISLKDGSGEIDLSGKDIFIRGKETKVSHKKCGEQAIGDCHGYAGSFVCGTALCEEHKKTHKH